MGQYTPLQAEFHHCCIITACVQSAWMLLSALMLDWHDQRAISSYTKGQHTPTRLLAVDPGDEGHPKLEISSDLEIFYLHFVEERCN